MKIAVLEVECHAEVLRATFQLFSRLIDFEITILTTLEIFEESGINLDSEKSFSLELKSSKESDKEFLRRNVDKINKHDYLLINTLQRKFNVYNKLHLKLPILIRVHNSNFYWSHNFQDKKLSLSNIRVLIKEFYRFEFLQRKKFLDKVDCFLFPSSQTLNYAKKQFNINTNNIQLFPLNFQGDTTLLNKVLSKSKTIVIPGKVDPLRKDFTLIEQFVKLLSTSQLNYVLDLVFLGVNDINHNQNFIKKLKSHTTNNLNIISFTDTLNAEVYQSYFQIADIVICPMFTHTVFQLSKEIYGKTKVSGGVNDAIHFSKLCFVPLSYSVDDELNEQIISFNSAEDLMNKVFSCLDETYSFPILKDDSYYSQTKQLEIIQSLFK